MQKSVLDIIKQLAPQLRLPTPQEVVGSQDTSIKLLYELLKMTCGDLYAEFPWQFLERRATITTVDGQEAYDLPSDVGRLLSCSFYNQANSWDMRGSLSAAQWESVKAAGTTASPFTKFRIFDDQLYLHPVPSASTYTFVFDYITTDCVRSSGGTPKPEPDADSDIILFDHRLVLYGTKIKWLEAKSDDTTTTLVEYNRALDFAKGTDTPAPVLDARGRCGTNLITTANIPTWM